MREVEKRSDRVAGNTRTQGFWRYFNLLKFLGTHIWF